VHYLSAISIYNSGIISPDFLNCSERWRILARSRHGFSDYQQYFRWYSSFLLGMIFSGYFVYTGKAHWPGTA
jgi:hypothetical protein